LEYHNLFDLLVILFILASAFFAFSRGFFQEIFSLFSWSGALLTSYFYSKYFIDYVDKILNNPTLSNLITYLVIFIVSLFLLSFISKKISGTIKYSSVGMIDRSLGFLFGVIRGYVLLCLMFFCYNFFFNDVYPKWLEKSKLSYILMKGSIELISIFDKDNQSINSIEEKIIEKSNSLFEKSIDSRLRRDKNDSRIDRGYNKNDRNNLDQLIDNIQDE
tara:strand:+ start:168 stop:821 length:654 start_codon:yes stop_codon:yes gene_type:complete